MQWTEMNSLTEIQSCIETIFEAKLRLHVKISDILDISFDEYIVLTNKLRNIQNAEVVERFCLSIFSAWVCSYRFNRQHIFTDFVHGFISSMPQHHTKFVLEALNTTFYDYQIDTFSFLINNIHDVGELAKLHAGF